MEFWLAPLHGITHYHFRNCLNRHVAGISVAVTPFLPVEAAGRLNVKKWVDIQPDNNVGLDIIPQLIGNTPSHFVDTIRALQGLGYERFNWNIGCPAAQVVRKRRGCGIMPYPEMVEAVVSEVANQTTCRFSIKMRLGLKRPQESFQILERLQGYPLDFVAVHPRLGVQEYEGVPDLTAFQQLQNAFHYHFVYSGDIVDLLSYHHIQSYFNVVDCCLLGRGILRNIFLAEELQSGKTLPREVRFRRFQHFYEDYTNTLLSARGPHAALANLKELWHYFATFFHLSPENLIELLRCTDYTAFDALVHDIVLRAQNV